MNGSSTPTSRAIWTRLAATGWIFWLGTLWWLSSRSVPIRNLPEFQFGDKIAHFGYFFTGGILLAIALRDTLPEWKRRALCIVAASALIGAADEYHQSFVENRYGNDPFD